MTIVTVDQAQLKAAADEIIRESLGRLRASVERHSRGLEQELEGITREAVPGKLWRAWKSSVYPKGIARAPIGEVYVSGGARSIGAIEFNSGKGRITAKSGQYLAFPTAAAGPRGRKRDITPGEWERANGARLRFVYRPGKRASFLVLDEGVISGRLGRAKLNTARRRATGRGNTTIIIFVLIPFVDFRPRFAIEPSVAKWKAAFASDVKSIFNR